MGTSMMIGASVGSTPLGTLLNQADAPVISDVVVSLITNAGFSIGANVNPNGAETTVSIEYGLTNAYGSTEATVTGSPVTVTGAISAVITGLSQFTLYHYRVKAVNSEGTTYSSDQTFTTLFYATLTPTGTGAGIATLAMEVSENQTFEIISGNARFYSDAGGTSDESTTWSITTGALRTIYMKATSGNSILNIPKPNKITVWGGGSDGWSSSTNAPYLYIEQSKLSILTQIRISGWSVLTGLLPTTLTVLRLSLRVTLVSSETLPTALTYLLLGGDSIDWTGLNIGNTGNITALSLTNFRNTKMSSADMITLLTQLTNRAGTLPATITINDYADYASPPAGVVTAVDALKLAKSITTVNLGA